MRQGCGDLSGRNVCGTEIVGQGLAFLREELDRTIPTIRMAQTSASYLAWLDCSALKLDAEPAEIFLARGRVALAPGRSFGLLGSSHVRLNFACSRELLKEAVSRISRALE